MRAWRDIQYARLGSIQRVLDRAIGVDATSDRCAHHGELARQFSENQQCFIATRSSRNMATGVDRVAVWKPALVVVGKLDWASERLRLAGIGDYHGRLRRHLLRGHVAR